MAKLYDWLKSRASALRRIGHAVEGLTVIGFFALGSGAAGYFFAQSQMRDDMVRERAEHLAEIDRLQKTYAETMAYVSQRVGETAKAAQVAADQSAQAAVEAKDTAKAAKRAVGATPAAAPAAAPISEAQRAEVNRKIDQANQKVRGK